MYRSSEINCWDFVPDFIVLDKNFADPNRLESRSAILVLMPRKLIVYNKKPRASKKTPSLCYPWLSVFACKISSGKLASLTLLLVMLLAKHQVYKKVKEYFSMGLECAWSLFYGLWKLFPSGHKENYQFLRAERNQHRNLQQNRHKIYII